MLKERVITALIMLCVFVGMVFFAPTRVWFVGVCILMAWAAAEWSNLAKFPQMIKAIYVMLMPVLLSLLWIAFSSSSYAWVFPTLMLLSIVFWLFLVPLWLFRGWRIENPLFLALCGAWVLLPTGMAFLYIRQSAEQAWLLVGLLMVVWIADVAAYFTGRAFGKVKLAPSISPGKTREGALGAWMGVAIYMSVLLLWLKPGVISAINFSVAQVLFFAFFLTYQSIMGDLFESWLKRCAGVKDSGASLPGHGGILDRIDAILPVLPLQVVILNWMMHGA